RQEADFEGYLRTVRGAGTRKNDIALLSAHQMSSCRMGANPARGALNPTGETFEVRNLFVADGSALPTATGVNPMLTIMAVSAQIAQHVKARLGKGWGKNKRIGPFLPASRRRNRPPAGRCCWRFSSLWPTASCGSRARFWWQH